MQPIRSIDDHVAILDEWITLLSALGMRGRHIEFHGSLAVWHRQAVRGITLRFRHAGVEIGDISVRAAALLLGSGIAPSASGAGGAVRRVVRGTVPADGEPPDVVMAFRDAYRFWSMFVSLVPWPQALLEFERERSRCLARGRADE